MEDVHWLVPTLAATSCWALSDVCCDYAIAGGDDDDAPPPPLPELVPRAVLALSLSLCVAGYEICTLGYALALKVTGRILPSFCVISPPETTCLLLLIRSASLARSRRAATRRA